MLQHQFNTPQNPARVVILGARGFIGRNLLPILELQGIPVLAIGSQDFDLAAGDTPARLAAQLREGDAVVMLSAITPDKGRDTTALLRNIIMAKTVCDAIAKQPVAHKVYISSDAVYAFDQGGLVNEDSPAAPVDLYGCMHRTRELMFESAGGAPTAVLRPTLVYGAGDTHNSYGPNRFRRVATKDGKITLGGNGEETRDHIYVEDLARLIALVLRHRSSGCLNLATGRSISFHDLARLIAARTVRPAEIVLTPRGAPITHRSFDITACHKAFPEFLFTPLETGLTRAQADCA